MHDQCKQDHPAEPVQAINPQEVEAMKVDLERVKRLLEEELEEKRKKRERKEKAEEREALKKEMKKELMEELGLGTQQQQQQAVGLRCACCVAAQQGYSKTGNIPVPHPVDMEVQENSEVGSPPSAQNWLEPETSPYSNSLGFGMELEVQVVKADLPQDAMSTDDASPVDKMHPGDPSLKVDAASSREHLPGQAWSERELDAANGLVEMQTAAPPVF